MGFHKITRFTQSKKHLVQINAANSVSKISLPCLGHIFLQLVLLCFPLMPSSFSISSCLLCDPACHYCASSKENSFHATEFSTMAETRLWTSELTIRPLWLQSGGSCSENVPVSQWTAGRCSKGHNHQRTLLPPANMCCYRCSNYLNVQKLRGGV